MKKSTKSINKGKSKNKKKTPNRQRPLTIESWKWRKHPPRGPNRQRRVGKLRKAKIQLKTRCNEAKISRQSSIHLRFSKQAWVRKKLEQKLSNTLREPLELNEDRNKLQPKGFNWKKRSMNKSEDTLCQPVCQFEIKGTMVVSFRTRFA